MRWVEDEVDEEDRGKHAAKAGEKCHIGDVFGICGERGEEVPKDDPRRKMKGRGVFRGCDVEDEDGAEAMFMELSRREGV